jgi:citronellyl-CoA dehydrogenase
MRELDELDGALAGLDGRSSGRDLWAALGAAGLIEAVYVDGDPRRGVIAERLGAVLAAADARCSIPATLVASVQLATGVPVLAAGDGPAAKALDRVVSGDESVALAATDGQGGSDLAGMATELTIGTSEVELRGSKRWIAGATSADHLLVLGRHSRQRHFTSFTWVLVPARAAGVHVRPAGSSLFAASDVGHVDLDGAVVPRDHVVGPVGRGLPMFVRHINTERLAGALWGTALCARSLDATRRRLAERPYGDGTLWDLDSVRQRFATSYVRARQLAALTDALAGAVVHDHDSAAAATLKAAAGETVNEVLATCAQLHGADGFAADGLQELRAQGALFAIGGGAAEVVLSIVADAAERLVGDLRRRPLAATGPAREGSRRDGS